MDRFLKWICGVSAIKQKKGMDERSPLLNKDKGIQRNDENSCVCRSHEEDKDSLLAGDTERMIKINAQICYCHGQEYAEKDHAGSYFADNHDDGLETEDLEGKHHFLQLQEYHTHVTDVTSCCVKYLLFVFNFIFTVLGLGVLAIGLWGLIVKKSLVAEHISHISTDPMLFLMLLGLIVTVLSLSGCVGALRENTCLLIFFTVGIATFVILEAIVGILLYILRDEIRNSLQNGMLTAIRRYQDDADLQFIIDEIQKGLHCCGVESYHDWEMNMYFNCSSPGIYACGVPASCCIDPQENGTVTNSQCGFRALQMDDILAQDIVYVSGCIFQISGWISTNMNFFSIICVIVVIVEVIGILFATRLLDDIKLQFAHC
ncbi:tetraspanin-10 [Protopterus annectens]|uniref:tetraspanin-10 n=1 Tax=Protopterus annectens TaxID=7888 RepID=UPI001CFAC17A|nr:tetraspanin-10 [Protopterus annectens]